MDFPAKKHTSLSPMQNHTLPRAISNTLANGFKYILHQDVSEPIVCLQAVVRSGSATELSNLNGYSHFLEHLVFKSSKRFGFNQISNTITKLGGSLNAYTDFDSTCYYLLLPSEHLEMGLMVLSELLINARFKPIDVEIEKDIILSEIDQYTDDPETDFLEYIQKRYYQFCPLRQPIIGFPFYIRAASFRRLKAFYKRIYNPENAFLVLSGDARPDSVQSMVQEFFGAWKQNGRRNKLLPAKWLEPEYSKDGLFTDRGKQVFLAYVLPELSELHPMSDALLMAIRYFAIGRSSRLHKRLVEEKKLCSAVRVSSLCGVMSGASVIMCIPSRKDAIEQICHIVREEFNHLWYHGIPRDEFFLVQQDIIHGWLFGFEARENIANLLVAEELLGDYQTLYGYGERIRSLTQSDILNAVHDYWNPDKFCMFYRGPGSVIFPFGTLPDARFFLMKTPPVSRKMPQLKVIEFDCVKEDTPKLQAALEQVDERHWQATLSNGIRFLYKNLGKNPISGFALSNPCSQLWESPENQGHNYFLSTALLYQTQNFSHHAIMDFSRRLGMNIRVVHNVDSTTYRGKCFHQDLPQALALLTEIVSQVKLDKSYLLTLKAAAIDALRREKDIPSAYGYTLWLNRAYGAHNPLGRVTGNQSQIKAININELMNWHAMYYHPGNFKLAVCSSMEAEQVYEIIENCLGKIPALEAPVLPQIQIPQPQKTFYKLSHRAIEQAVIHIGAPGPHSDDKIATTASHLLAQIIGGDFNSRFFDLIREKNGLAYQAGMDFVTLEHSGFWVAYAFCTHKGKKTCRTLMQEIISDVAQRGVTEEELAKAKSYVSGMHLFDCESVSYQASALSNLFALGYPIQHLLQRAQRIASIDLDTINSIAQKWLSNSAYWVHILQ